MNFFAIVEITSPVNQCTFNMSVPFICQYVNIYILKCNSCIKAPVIFPNATNGWRVLSRTWEYSGDSAFRHLLSWSKSRSTNILSVMRNYNFLRRLSISIQQSLNSQTRNQRSSTDHQRTLFCLTSVVRHLGIWIIF